MVTTTFGPLLYAPATDPIEEFRSPNSLKKKVLISTKPPKEYLETQDPEGKGNLQRLKTSSKKEVAQIGKSYSKTESEVT